MKGSKLFKLVTPSPMRINVKIKEFFVGEVEG
jgi:hypothetical protein